MVAGGPRRVPPMARLPIRIVGAGLGRTGTHSLKVALEQLLGAPCYHMVECFQHPDHPDQWRRAYEGEDIDWAALLDGYAAIVDWPGGGIWQPIAEAFPDAPVLLSTRSSADQWWTSASNTIFEGMADLDPDSSPWAAMALTMMEAFTPGWLDEDSAKAAYDAHNAEVRATCPPDRLVEWQPADGWGPLCDALGVPVPEEPFPVTNTTEEFRARRGLS